MSIIPPSFNFKGDRQKSISLKAQARQFYNFVVGQAELGGVPLLSKTRILPDGSVITVTTKKEGVYNNRTGFITINTLPYSPEELEEEEALILQFAANGFEEGWGKPYTSGLGTPDGHNPWTILKTNKSNTTFSLKKGLELPYFTNNDDVTYSLSPNIGNCYWGDTDDKVISWVGPHNQIGPIVIDGDDSYGGVLSDVYFSNEGSVSVAIGSPSGNVYISEQFDKKVFKNKTVIAEFTNYVLAACKTIGSLGDCIIALTASSLTNKAGLHYYIEIYWLTTSTIEVKSDIDMTSYSALFPTFVGAFNLTATECIIAFHQISLSPTKLKLLTVDLSNIAAITHSVSDTPLPIGSATNKRLYASVGYPSPTSVSTRSHLLSYGYNYENNSKLFSYLIISFDSYFSGGRYITSHIQIGEDAYFIGGISDSHFTFPYTSLYGSSPFIGSWFYPDLGLFTFLPTLVYNNIQRKQIGLFFWSTTQAIDASVPTGSFMPVRLSSHYFNLTSEIKEMVGITSDDYMTRNKLLATTDHWPLGNSNTYSNPIKTSFTESVWDSIGGASNSLEIVRSCDFKINGVIPYVEGTSIKLNYLQYKYVSNQHLYFNGISYKKYSLGTFNLKGPFAWYYQSDYPFPKPPDYSGNFKCYFQTANNTSTIVPTGYLPIKDISTSFSLLSSQDTPRIKRSRFLPPLPPV